MKVSEIARQRVRPNNVRGTTSIVGRIPAYRLRMTVRPETFGERVRRLRIARGWDQRQLAEAAGIGQMSVSQSERDLIPGVTALTVSLLATALGVSMDYLWGQEQAS